MKGKGKAWPLRKPVYNHYITTTSEYKALIFNKKPLHHWYSMYSINIWIELFVTFYKIIFEELYRNPERWKKCVIQVL